MDSMKSSTMVIKPIIQYFIGDFIQYFITIRVMGLIPLP